MVLHEKVWIGREVRENSTRYVLWQHNSGEVCGRSDGGFEVKVGLHQGSALSPCLFAMLKDRMTDEIREEAPWTMMFAGDIVICSESKEHVEEKLESWLYALERRGMKVNRRKTEYMCVNERQDTGSGTVKMQGEEVAKVDDFKYLGSTVQSNGECGREVKKRVQAGWNGWRRMSDLRHESTS